MSTRPVRNLREDPARHEPVALERSQRVGHHLLRGARQAVEQPAVAVDSACHQEQEVDLPSPVQHLESRVDAPDQLTIGSWRGFATEQVRERRRSHCGGRLTLESRVTWLLSPEVIALAPESCTSGYVEVPSGVLAARACGSDARFPKQQGGVEMADQHLCQRHGRPAVASRVRLRPDGTQETEYLCEIDLAEERMRGGSAAAQPLR